MTELPDWVSAYVGLPFKEGGRNRDGLDCYGLLRLVINERFAGAVPEYEGIAYRPGEDSSLLAALIIYFFLANIRTTLISAVAIPTSIISTFGMMGMMGLDLNSITMLALTLMVGIVIDDAIIVLENIYRYMEEKGLPLMQAAIRSAGGLVIILMVAWFRGVPLFRRDGTLKAGLLAGIFFGVEFILIYRGLVYTTASRAVVFLYIAPFIVALGSKHVQTAERPHVIVDLDVDATAGHVRRDRDSASLASILDDLCLARMLLRVEDGVRYALPLQKLAQVLRRLDGDRSDEDRLAREVTLLDVANDSGELRFLRLEDQVVEIGRAHV